MRLPGAAAHRPRVTLAVLGFVAAALTPSASAAPPVVGAPRIDGETAAKVGNVAARGAGMGLRAGVFAKLGDSITESQSFLYDIGMGWNDPGPYEYLKPTISSYRATVLGRQDDADENSFNRSSLVAEAGWQVTDLLSADGIARLERELDEIRPALALIMFGTNDLVYLPARRFSGRLDRLQRWLTVRGVIPVLSTIPDRVDTAGFARRVDAYNASIRRLARRRHLPLMEYHRALESLPGHGLDADGIHPNALHGDSAGVWTQEGLRYGYNVRNLLAVETLHRLRPLL